MQLRRCITRGVRNYSHVPIFNLLRVRVISVEWVLEMSERVTYSMVSQYSTNCSRSLHSLSSPSRATSRNPFIGAAAAISRGMHCERPRTRLSPSCSHITPLALTTHLAPLALTTHLSHSPLTSHSHLLLAVLLLLRTRNLQRITSEPATPSEPATCNASPPNPQHLPRQFSLPRYGDSRTHHAPLTSEPATPRR
jgi:hypothetical protein